MDALSVLSLYFNKIKSRTYVRIPEDDGVQRTPSWYEVEEADAVSNK